jgi:hypothetical protein
MKKKRRKCRKRGCKAPPLKNGIFYFAHDPGRQEERRKERSRGGKTSTAPKIFKNERFSLQTIPEVKDMLTRLANAALNGEIDLGRARTAGYLASLILSCLKDYDPEKRMEAIEAMLENQN